MSKNLLISTLLATILVGAIPRASQAAPPDTKQWSVHHETLIQSGTEYELYNRSSQLGHARQSQGVDLGWVQGHMGGLFQFMHEAPPNVRDHRRRPISGSDKMALFNRNGGGFLKYYSRGNGGAEVTWTRTPAYEWQLHDQSTSEGRVNFALYNVRVRKYLVNRVQSYGINLGWFETPRPPQSFSLALSAQPVVQGWVPFAGSFGQNTRGNLLTVQNASQNATLMFLKPGKSTSQCSDPNATLRVAPRGLMTAEQMQILYGAATPRLPTSFLACLTTPTPQSISLTLLNLTYRLDP